MAEEVGEGEAPMGGGQRGQSTVEWLALILLVALALATLALVAGARIPGFFLARAVADRIVCAVRLSEDCTGEPELQRAHGAEIAAVLRTHAPTLLYEDGMRALPVDYRLCREDACAEGAGDGTVARSEEGRRVAAFTHVIDCRAAAVAATEAAGMDCSGPRARHLYLQYWFYYPGSATAEGSTILKGPIRTASTAVGRSTFHPDDWESFTVRIGPDGRFARASSHRGYDGWSPELGTVYISGGSHAGRAARRPVPRMTKDHRVALIPIETLTGRETTSFAITPPWRKRVYLDPEYAGTD